MVILYLQSAPLKLTSWDLTKLVRKAADAAYATLKKVAAIANHDGKRLDDRRFQLILQACDDIPSGGAAPDF
jgi:aspartate ammonia-lyase